MTKIKKCFSLSEETVGEISRISSQTATPESTIVEKYLTKCISEELEITAGERFHFQRKYINDSLDSVLRLMGIMDSSGGVQDKYKLALYVAQGNQRAKNREYRNGIIETSLFEILETIRGWDDGVWNDLTTHMAHFGKIRVRYFNLYPKLKKTGITRKKKDNTINNNTTILDNIDNIDSLDKQENLPKTNTVTESKKTLINKKYPGLDEHGRDIK